MLLYRRRGERGLHTMRRKKSLLLAPSQLTSTEGRFKADLWRRSCKLVLGWTHKMIVRMMMHSLIHVHVHRMVGNWLLMHRNLWRGWRLP